MQRNCNQSYRQATVFVIKGKAKPGHYRGRGQWKATSFLHDYVSKLGACARDEVWESMRSTYVWDTWAHLRAGRGRRVSSNMADHGLGSGMAMASSWTATPSSLAGIRVPGPPCSELAGGKTWSPSLHSRDAEMKSAFALQDLILVRKTRIQREGKTGRRRLFTKQRSPLLQLSTETDVGPQSHCHLPLTSCVPRVSEAQSVGSPEGAFQGPCLPPTCSNSAERRTQQNAEEGNSLGPQMALSTNPVCLDFWTWPLYHKDIFTEDTGTSKEKRQRVHDNTFFYEIKAQHGQEKYFRDKVSWMGIWTIISKDAFWLKENFANLFCFPGGEKILLNIRYWEAGDKTYFFSLQYHKQQRKSRYKIIS